MPITILPLIKYLKTLMPSAVDVEMRSLCLSDDDEEGTYKEDEQFEAEVLEMHHHDKKDAPSGTAERLIEILKDQYNLNSEQCIHGREGQVGARPKQEIGVHALRGGDIVGEHTVFFCGQGERVELTHKATDRTIFAQGALFAAHWTKTAINGLFNMEDVLGISE